MYLRIDSYGVSDIGNVREVNEDRFLIADLCRSLQIHSTNLDHDDQTRLYSSSQSQLFAVADGMGGHASGDRASTVAVDTLITYTLNCMHWFHRLGEDPKNDFLDELKSALEQCHAEINAEAEVLTDREGMGTTVTAGYIVWPRLYVVHVGDSRCYLFRDKRLCRITTDHTVSQRLADEGILADEEIERSRFSHMLWNVVGGGSDDIMPEVNKVRLAAGDTLMFCSDGLTNHVGEDEIAAVLKDDQNAADTCQKLVGMAKTAGGSDNITVVIARFVEDTTADTIQAERIADQSVEEAKPASRRDHSTQGEPKKLVLDK